MILPTPVKKLSVTFACVSTAMIKQLLSSITWNVDYLIIDTPPGTSDEHISVMENLRLVSCFPLGQYWV